MPINELSASFWRTNTNRKIDALRAEGFVTIRDAAKMLGLSEPKALLVLPEPDRRVKHGARRLRMWQREKVEAMRGG